MPTIDMPLEQLKTYMGTNPCPDDIDTYWDCALQEMRAAKAHIARIPAPFHAAGVECFDLTFTGVGDASIYAKYIRPKGQKNCGAVVCFHGYSGNSGDWTDKLPYVYNGYCVAAMDCRGQGGRSEDSGRITGTTFKGHIIRGVELGPQKLLFRNIMLDAAQLAGIVMGFEEVDPARVGVLGGSQGGGLALACAALEPGIARAAVQHPFLCDYKRVWDMDLAKDAFEEISYWFRMFDPLHAREKEFFHTLGYIDVKNMVHRIKAHVLMATGLMDQIVPPSTQFAAYNRIASKKEMVIYPDFGHEPYPGWIDRAFTFLTEFDNSLI